jgi:hypothetical protein
MTSKHINDPDLQEVDAMSKTANMKSIRMARPIAVSLSRGAMDFDDLLLCPMSY